jgi:hypothetical protein
MRKPVSSRRRQQRVEYALRFPFPVLRDYPAPAPRSRRAA